MVAANGVFWVDNFRQGVLDIDMNWRTTGKQRRSTRGANFVGIKAVEPKARGSYFVEVWSRGFWVLPSRPIIPTPVIDNNVDKIRKCCGTTIQSHHEEHKALKDGGWEG